MIFAEGWSIVGEIIQKDFIYNVLFMLLLALVSFACELFGFFPSYAPKEPDKMPPFIRREKGKAIATMLGGGVMLAYSLIKGNSIFGAACLIAFSFGIYAAAKRKEKE